MNESVVCSKACGIVLGIMKEYDVEGRAKVIMSCKEFLAQRFKEDFGMNKELKKIYVPRKEVRCGIIKIEEPTGLCIASGMHMLSKNCSSLHSWELVFLSLTHKPEIGVTYISKDDPAQRFKWNFLESVYSLNEKDTIKIEIKENEKKVYGIIKHNNSERHVVMLNPSNIKNLHLYIQPNGITTISIMINP